MSKQPSSLRLIAFFAAAAGLAAYGFTPHKVEVNVFSKGTISDQQGKIVEKYLVTDAGNIPMNDTSGFRIGSSQKTTCESFRDITFKRHLRDCSPN